MIRAVMGSRSPLSADSVGDSHAMHLRLWGERLNFTMAAAS
jgi:hypothetical protein